MNINNLKMTPRDFFLNLGALITLYITVPTLLNLIFSIVDVAYPRFDRYYYTSSTISFPVATLIVVFPLFLVFMWLLSRSYKKSPEKRTHFLKKWITYVTLFISGAVIAGDLVTVLYFFLDGQLMTTGFILKCVAVFVITGAVFKYYIADLLGYLSALHNKFAAVVATILVVGTIVWGFSVMGSPYTQRMIRYDIMKVNDLQSLQSYLVGYWQQKAALPQTLAELEDPISSYMIPTDPQTKQRYEYRKVSENSFELCAAFNRESKDGDRMYGDRYPYDMAVSSRAYPYGIDEKWDHSAGRVCFNRTIDPALYPPYSEKPIR